LSPRPILILSAGRAGSNLLKSFFRPNPSVRDIGEFLNPDRTSHDPAVAFWGAANAERVARLGAERLDPKAPRIIFCEFVEWLLANSGGRTVLADLKYDHVGLVDALWRSVDEPPPSVAAFIHSRAVILHLVRRNPLAQLASVQLASKTGIWLRRTSRSTEAVQETPSDTSCQTIRIDPRHIGDRLRRIVLRQHVAAQWVARARSTRTLIYEDLLEGDRLAEPVREAIVTAVDREIDLSGVAGTLKLAPPLNNLIENNDEIRAALAGGDFAWCIDEAPPSDTIRRSEGGTVSPDGGAQRIDVPMTTFALPLSSGGSKTHQQRTADARRTVFIARELPGYLGGRIDLRAVAERLAAEGFTPVLALPASDAYGQESPPFDTFPAPQWPAIAAGAVRAEPREYLDLLAAIGFTDLAAVAGMAKAWRSLITALQPVAVIADHSPGLIASQASQSTTLIAIGGPTTLPPITSEGIPPLLGQRASRPPIEPMISALRDIGRHARTEDAGGLAGLLDSPFRLVLGLREFDPYLMVRSDPLFLPPEFDFGLPPPARDRQLLAILPDYSRPALLAALSETDFPSIVLHASDKSSTLKNAMASASHVLHPLDHPAGCLAAASGRPRSVLRQAGSEQWFQGLAAPARTVDSRLPQDAIRNAMNAFLADGEALERARLVGRWIAMRGCRSGSDRLIEIVRETAEVSRTIV